MNRAGVSAVFARGLPAVLTCMLGVSIGASISNSQQEVKSFGNRVVGGVPTTIQEHPWQVALKITQQDGSYLCGGSIVGVKWVLTAAHCFVPLPQPGGAVAKAGATHFMSEGVWTPITRATVHSAYNGQTHENDLAMLKLATPPNGTIIPMADLRMVPAVGQPLEVTGWGATTEGGAASDVLRKAEVPYVDTTTCNAPESYNGAIRPGMMCAGHSEGGTDSCQGDSGGPLVWKTAQGSILVGVVSFGAGCARKLKYGVYTRVSAYRDWIGRIVASDPN
jgi:secreted trypsin-like serine protease